jgi:hypothetical protein
VIPADCSSARAWARAALLAVVAELLGSVVEPDLALARRRDQGLHRVRVVVEVGQRRGLEQRQRRVLSGGLARHG